LVKVSLAIRNVEFYSGPMTHGSKNHRAPGAIGGNYAWSYYLVKKMAGQLGNKITTIQKLKVIQIDLENILVIKDLFQENLVTY
jgi:large subunit ribosomal protein L3